MTTSQRGLRRDARVGGAAVGAIGAALAAAVASVCCIGPLVVSVLGVSGAVAAARIAPYRPYLLLASAVLIGYGFWRLANARARCADRTCEQPPGKAMWILMWTAGAIALGSFLLPWIVS